MSTQQEQQPSEQTQAQQRKRYVTCADLAEEAAELSAALMSIMSFIAGGGDIKIALDKLKGLASQVADLHSDALKVLRYEKTRSNTSYTGRRGTRSSGGVSWKRRSRY